MRAKAPLVLLVAILTLAASAVLVLVTESLDQSTAAVRGREYQELVGGLGFGPAVDLSRCACSFDPRLCHRCPEQLRPIPGGGYFCPQHACSILYYRY